jgi:hypothetical protein
VKIPFRANSNTIQSPFEIRRLGGDWITKSNLQNEWKGLYLLYSQTVQAVVHKFLQVSDGKVRE